LTSLGVASASIQIFRLNSFRMGVDRPNEMQISCRPSGWRPHQPTLPLFGLEGPGARTEVWPAPACRLHLRVRQLARAEPPPAAPIPLPAIG